MVWLKQRLWVRRGTALFVNWHCLDNFDIPTHDLEKLFTYVPSWSDSEGSWLLVIPTLTLLSYCSTLPFCKTGCSVLLPIAVAEHCAFALLSQFMSVLVGGPVDYVHIFQRATTLAESNVLLPLFPGVNGFFAHGGLFFNLLGSQFEFKEAYLAYHHSHEVNWEDEVRVGWFQYVDSSGDMLDIPALEVGITRRTATDVQL